jgi:protein-S-isoprenylcysteine O-methyltransferase Ste14
MNETDQTRAAPRHVAAGVALQLLYAASYFLAAGRLAACRGWVAIGLVVVAVIGNRLWVRRRNPELARYRTRVGAGTPAWDRWWLTVFMLLPLVVNGVAGLDAERFHWAPLPLWSLWAGLLLWAGGYLLSTWAMASNPHFEGTVRIQRERNHTTIDAGPYRYVRHPGYVGFGLVFLALPLILGSAWALVPGAAIAAWLVLRTALEDRILLRELEGYGDYAARVRWRLVPWVW